MGIVFEFSEGSPNSSFPLGDLSLSGNADFSLENSPKTDRPFNFKFLIVIQNIGRIVRADRNNEFY